MANVTPSQCQKYANVTPCQCQKNANRDAIWVLSITRRDQFSSFLEVKEGKKLILTYVAVFRGARSLIYEKFLLCDRVPLISLIADDCGSGNSDFFLKFCNIRNMLQLIVKNYRQVSDTMGLHSYYPSTKNLPS